MDSSANEQKVQVSKCNREFQIRWTEKHGLFSKGDKAVCVLCSGTVKLLRAVDTRRYPRVENRIWSDQEDHEERGSKDRAAKLVGPTVTRSTIRVDVGVAIVPQTRQLRLQWCQARSMWNVTDWQKVVFSDESRFVLGTDDNSVQVWKRPGERYNSLHTVLRRTARTAGVMVWGAIAYDSRSTLIVMRGTLTGQRYVDDILRPHVGPFLNGLPRGNFPAR
ncbi:transposable element Tcb2 transposase [Trichonephila clavipes]|nr:transposable element Tcb2 transposase [Trichonephila clavipes]